jgi:MFS family permease
MTGAEPGRGDTVEAGYRAALATPTVRNLWTSSAVSQVGDYVGQGALLLLAYDRAGGRVLGSAAVLAAAAVPALLSSALAGSWLDRLPRGRALAGAQVAGAAVVVLPVVVPGLAIVFVAAALLGAVKAVTIAVRAGAMAEAVEDRHRGPLVALLSTTDQTGQVVGYTVGAGLAATVGASPALLIDAASFLVGAAVISRIPFPAPLPRQRRPGFSTGVRDIVGNPVLRLLAPLVWITATVGSLPEALAAGVVGADDAAWLPFVLAAAPAGQALTMLVIGRLPQLGRPSVQLVHLAWLSLAFGIAALGRSPGWFVLANLLVGSGVAWTIGPQLAFVRLAPPERMAQVTGTMIAVVIAADGLGTPLFAWIADRTSVAATYRIAGVVVLAAALVGWAVKERTPLASQLDAAADPSSV